MLYDKTTFEKFFSIETMERIIKLQFLAGDKYAEFYNKYLIYIAPIFLLAAFLGYAQSSFSIPGFALDPTFGDGMIGFFTFIIIIILELVGLHIFITLIVEKKFKWLASYSVFVVIPFILSFYIEDYTASYIIGGITLINFLVYCVALLYLIDRMKEKQRAEAYFKLLESRNKD